MSDDALPAEELPRESVLARWKDLVLSGLFMACGWVLVEYTAAPFVGVVVASGKFGWNDFLTAFWLQRRDPDRDRRAACFWFYLASGLWKVTVVAFILTVLMGMAAQRIKVKPRKVIGGSVFLTVSGLGLLTIVPVIGALRARHGRVKIWVNGSLHAFRRRNMWPVWPTGRNRVRGLMLSALILPLLITAALARFAGPFVIAALVAEATILWTLSQKVAARTPEEAWGDAWALTETDPHPDHDPDEDERDDLHHSWTEPSLVDS